MIQTSPGPRWGCKLVARSQPSELDTLRLEMRPLIGTLATWRCIGKGDEGEPYPGQHRWIADDARFGGRWVPDEDLIETAGELV